MPNKPVKDINIAGLTSVSQTLVFNGTLSQYTHYSDANKCTMRFSIYLPPHAANKGIEGKVEKVPVIYWLSGLTCTDENFMQKAGALKIAAQLGIAIVAPDTSPRGVDVPDDPQKAYDFGLGAGFYLNATQAPYERNYHMYDYILDELLELIESSFPVTDKKSISGHSMGGHGALTIGLRNPDVFASISAFSPICNPMECAWGIKAFTQYLGDNSKQWTQYDATELIKRASVKPHILIDQGGDDNFLETQLKPENLVKAALLNDYTIQLNIHPGYDHSYYFISTFIDEHITFHAQFLH
ncbi:MAG: S-formylglutathione hydrolase [Gammaproteobacteria bacterium]|jgi:S-formylglutathione hydrolase